MMLLKIFNILVEILRVVKETQNHLPAKQLNPINDLHDDLIDNTDAKRMLQICDRTLYRWRKKKLIDSQMIGNKYYYRKSDLRRFL
jgi:hypothetical protein